MQQFFFEAKIAPHGVVFLGILYWL